jgi:vacuolar protein sorting-associated protein 53
MEDFEAYYNSTSTLSAANMSAACEVIETLGDKYHRKFIESINDIILRPYQDQYSTPENGVLENTERRYGFIKRKMEEFNSKFDQIVPRSWGIDCLILYEFCSITRINLTHILEATSHTVNVAVLMKALELSLKFEQKITELMKNKYESMIKDGRKKKIELQALPKFVGSISNSF